MTPGTKTDRWKLIQDIFQAALDLPLSERGDYVARASGGDEDLCSEVSSLLANDRDDTRTIHSLVASDLKGLAGAASSPGISSGAKGFEIPKSMSLTTPSDVTNTLPGLISR